MSPTEKQYPQTVSDAVEILHANMTLNQELLLASMDAVDLLDLHMSLGHQIRGDFGLWTGNNALMESCRSVSSNPDLHVDDASMVIVKALWEKSREANLLKDT
ncbi:MAG TPA: hypothetical protein PLN83_11385 [Syntrophorhabdus sp.]|nr:hypothetical protein [Syntrophorhabdus sp.]